MRGGSTTLRTVLTGGSFDHWYSADFYYNGDRRLQNVPITQPSFSEDSTAQIQQSGSCTVVWDDDFGASISPTAAQSVLAPFGSEIYLYSNISSGPFLERVSLGQFRITNVPSAQDEAMLWQGQYITTGSVVQIEFKERLVRVQQDIFDAPYAPSDLSSTWDELGRLTYLQLSRNIADAAIARSVAYQQDRLQGCYDLATGLDAVLHMTYDGALAMRPNAWPTAVDSLLRGDGGTIISVGNVMAPDTVFNKVVVTSSTDAQSGILATAEVTDGPLRTTNADGTPGPWGRVPEHVSPTSVTTIAAAQAYAALELSRVAVLGQKIVPVTETFNPLRERGDVITLERAGETILGRIQTIDRDDGPTMNMTVAISG